MGKTVINSILQKYPSARSVHCNRHRCIGTGLCEARDVLDGARSIRRIDCHTCAGLKQRTALRSGGLNHVNSRVFETPADYNQITR